MVAELLRGPNSSSHTGHKLDRHPCVPKGNEIPLSPHVRYSFHTGHRCTYCQSPSSWLAWSIWQELPVEGHGRGLEVPPAALWECRASQGANNSLRGVWGKRHLLWCHLIFPQGHWCSGSGGMMGSFWGLLQRRGNPSSLHARGRGLGGTMQPWGPLAGPQGYHHD